MNERIQELLIQCQHESIDGPEYPRWTDLEKFAELIVEEMYDFIMEESANDNGIPDLGKVKQHFGVRE